MNQRLNLDIPQNITFLLPRDVLFAIDHLIAEGGEIRLLSIFLHFLILYSAIPMNLFLVLLTLAIYF
jgi:hypothetical protein